MTSRQEDGDTLGKYTADTAVGERSGGRMSIDRRAADILDVLSDAVFAFDSDWHWVYINPAARTIMRTLDINPESLLGRVVWDSPPTMRGSRFEAEATRAARDSVVVEYEEYFPETERWVEYRIVPTRGLVTAHRRDVTAVRRVERENSASVDRARRLLTIATRLAGASTTEQVAKEALTETLAATGAESGSLALLRHDDATGPMFETVAYIGYQEELNRRFKRFPLKAGRPLSDAILTGQPVLITSRTDWASRYNAGLIQTSELPGEAMANIPVMVEGVPFAGISISFTDARTFDEPTRTFLATIGEQTGIALGRARAFERERQARSASAFLSEASRVLVSSLDYEQTLRAVAELAVPRLGDWCAVDIVTDPDSDAWPPVVERLAFIHRDPTRLATANELARRYPTDWSLATGLAGVIRDRITTFVPAITDEMLAAGIADPERLALTRQFGFTGVIMVPLVARSRTLGAITLVTSEPDRVFEESDLALAQELAQRAAQAIDNATLYRDARNARGEAEQANSAKSAFLATMSHELRTPLNAIGGYADLLEMGLHGALTDAQRDAIRRIKRAHGSLLGLVEDVLSFARLESGRLVYNFSPVPLNMLLAGLDAFIAPQIAKRGLAYEYTAVDSSITVWTDPEKLEQVILNLLTNALKFTERGVVALCAEVGPADVRICVSDTGVGIPDDKLEAIFEPFVQLESGLTRRTQGTGLGLAISRDIARAMQGELTVTSEVNGGSRFMLRLPRRASSA